MTDEKCEHVLIDSIVVGNVARCPQCNTFWNAYTLREEIKKQATLAENKRVMDELTAHVCNQFFFRDASRELLLNKIDSLRLPKTSATEK